MYELKEIEIRYDRTIPTSCSIICSSEDAERIFRGYWKMISINESSNVLYLDQKNQVIGIQQLSIGGINSTVVDVRLILATALKCLAVGIILAHNHPSGNLKPSEVDKKLTERIKAACQFHDIRFLDNLILSPQEGQYFSFADNGMI